MKAALMTVIVLTALLAGGCPGPTSGNGDAAQGERAAFGADAADGGALADEAPCPSAQETFEKIAPATYVVLIEYRLAPGEDGVVCIPVATAFGVGPNILATNAHVVQATLDATVFPIERVLAAQSGTRTVVELVGAVAHPD